MFGAEIPHQTASLKTLGDIIVLIVKKDEIFNFNNYQMKEIGTTQIIFVTIEMILAQIVQQ